MDCQNIESVLDGILDGDHGDDYFHIQQRFSKCGDGSVCSNGFSKYYLVLNNILNARS